MKILLVEDDQSFAQSIRQLLESHHYSVDLAEDGQMAQEMAEVFSYDLILLDWMLPRKTGIEVCSALREEGDRTPIILMTGQDSRRSEVTGLDSGADDYLVKPFGFEELLARIRAVLRRSEGIASPILEWGALRLNPSSAEVSCALPDGQQVPISLTPKEYGLLEVFLRNPNRIFSMDALIDKVWPFDDTPTTGAIRTHIKGLRQKMRAVGLAEVIDTVYGLGYRLSPAIAVVAKETSFSADSLDKLPIKANATVSQLDLSALWAPVKETYLQRVSSLSKTLHAIPIGSLHSQEREDILTEAHALAGSLGSFGFTNATPQCRQIERLVRDYDSLDRTQLQALRAAIKKVKQTLIEASNTADAMADNAADAMADNTAARTALPSLRNQRKVLESSVRRRNRPSAAKLLIVDDDAALLSLLQSLLEDWGFQIRLLDNPQQFWTEMEQFAPDMVLLDIEMPNTSGFDLCQQLRDEPRWSELPILFLSAHTEADTIQRVFSVGADDYIRKPIVAAELMARVISWLERSRDRRLKAEVDGLTGVSNRQKSEQEITRLLSLAERYEQPLCLAVIDIDGFKQVNSEFGHAVGDRILRHFGACLRSSFRCEDVVARWGGEEFIVGLYGVDCKAGERCLRKFRQKWARVCETHSDIKTHITFSVGVATYPQDAASLQELHQAADKRLQTKKCAFDQTVLPSVR